jgi:epsin
LGTEKHLHNQDFARVYLCGRGRPRCGQQWYATTLIEKEEASLTDLVRISAKELTSLILDEERLRSERSDRKLWKTRVTGIDEYAPQGSSNVTAPREARRDHRGNDQEDAELRLAIEASKYEAEEDQKRRNQSKGNAADMDDDLAKAIKLSQEEESLRARQLEEQNAASLFDDTPAPSQPQPTGYNQGYQQQPAVDWFGNPLQQQPQQTGYLNNQYAQPTGYQPQQTGYQNGFSNGFPSQPGAYDQFGSQPFLPQQNTIQPQQTAFQNNNPYGAMQQQPSFTQQPQQQALQTGTNNPWGQQQQAAEPLKPLPTGSNNPFAQKAASPSPFQRTQTQPSLGTLFESQPTNSFQQQTQYQPSQPNPISNFTAPVQQQPQKAQDPHAARLNALLASGEGQDTFGNTGDLRIPAQHTAPGTFVNSAGQGRDKLIATQTGSNPFFSQQFTGAPQMPAQTGPVGYGGGGYGGQQNHNPFGARPQQQGGGSLIDL